MAGYAAHAIGASKAVPFSNLSTGTVRPADLTEAREFLERAQRFLPSGAWYYKDRDADQLSAIHRLQGRPKVRRQSQRQAHLLQGLQLDPRRLGDDRIHICLKRWA